MPLVRPEPLCSWLHQPSICVLERPRKACVCACVHLCEEGGASWFHNMCWFLPAAECVQSVFVWYVVQYLHCMLLRTACDLPAWVWMRHECAGRKEGSDGVAILQCCRFLIIKELLKFYFMNEQWQEICLLVYGGKRQFDSGCVLCVLHGLLSLHWCQRKQSYPVYSGSVLWPCFLRAEDPPAVK